MVTWTRASCARRSPLLSLTTRFHAQPEPKRGRRTLPRCSCNRADGTLGGDPFQARNFTEEQMILRRSPYACYIPLHTVSGAEFHRGADESRARDARPLDESGSVARRERLTRQGPGGRCGRGRAGCGGCGERIGWLHAPLRECVQLADGESKGHRGQVLTGTRRVDAGCTIMLDCNLRQRLEVRTTSMFFVALFAMLETEILRFGGRCLRRVRSAAIFLRSTPQGCPFVLRANPTCCQNHRAPMAMHERAQPQRKCTARGSFSRHWSPHCDLPCFRVRFDLRVRQVNEI